MCDLSTPSLAKIKKPLLMHMCWQVFKWDLYLLTGGWEEHVQHRYLGCILITLYCLL